MKAKRRKPCFYESVGLPQTIALRKNTVAHNAPGATIMARSGIPILPEMSFYPVFRQTPGDRNADVGQKIATKTSLLALKIQEFH
jgi:hypothetical protein